MKPYLYIRLGLDASSGGVQPYNQTPTAVWEDVVNKGWLKATRCTMDSFRFSTEKCSGWCLLLTSQIGTVPPVIFAGALMWHTKALEKLADIQLRWTPTGCQLIFDGIDMHRELFRRFVRRSTLQHQGDNPSPKLHALSTDPSRIHAAIMSNALGTTLAQREVVIKPESVLDDAQGKPMAGRLAVSHGPSAYRAPLARTS